MSANEPKHAESAEAAWTERKTWNETWARADTERWLDERSPQTAALTRALGVTIKREPKLMGLWLRARLPGNFNVAHANLAAMTIKQRAAATVVEVLPKSAITALDSRPPFPTRR